MIALTRKKIAMAAINASRIRIVFRVSILYHFKVIAAPNRAYQPTEISRRANGGVREGRTVYREETPAAPVISEVTAMTFPTWSLAPGMVWA